MALTYRARLSEWPTDQWRTVSKAGRIPLKVGDPLVVPTHGGTFQYRVASVDPDPDGDVTAQIVLVRSGVA